MYRIVVGKVSVLSAGALPRALYEQAPQGARRTRWLAGRVLLSHALSPLPDIVYGEQGKPAFSGDTPLWFNLSHSGDDIALLLSDEGKSAAILKSCAPVITGGRWQIQYSVLGNMLKLKPNTRTTSWRRSGASGRAKRPSLSNVAAAPGKLSASTAPP